MADFVPPPITSSSEDEGSASDQPLNLGTALADALTDADDGFLERDPQTFAASHIGFCPRQVYLTKLGLKDTSDVQGRFSAGQLVRTHIEETLRDTYPTLEVSPRVAFDCQNIRFIGRCTAYDPDTDIVYHVRTRNGWYRFHPPVERHLDQLHIYMQGLNATRGQLVYVSLADLLDLKVWPPAKAEAEFLEFDDTRFTQLVAKAETIRQEILANGIATDAEDIPFARCDCYFCNEETLDLPDPPETTTAAEADDSDPFTRASNMPDDSADTAPPKSPVSDIPTDGTHPLSSDGYHVPKGLQDLRIWVVWDCRNKIALAPWETGTMYPCEWAADKDVNPRRPFQKAHIVANMPIEQVHAAWPFPDENNLPEQVKPTVLLPHEPHDPPLMFVDFDDVRDPHTGETTSEVVSLLDALGGYAEVSQSGTGIHVFVRGRLPPDRGRVIAPLEMAGSVELYDHSRFTASTWQHISGTPRNQIPEAQAAINTIVDTYA